MRALEETRRGRVGRDGLVVLALGRERVREPNPGRAKVRVHHAGLGEEPSGLGDALDEEIVDANGEPRARLLGMMIRQLVRGEEEVILAVELVQTRQVERINAEVVPVGRQDRLRQRERLGEAAVRVEELGPREKQIGVVREVVVRRQRLRRGIERGRILVLGEARRVKHLGEFGRLL